MEALVLMERLNGEILANKIRAFVDGEITVLAALSEDNEWEFTEKGQELANVHSNLAVDEAAATSKPSRKKATPAVESAETQPEQEPQAAAEQPAAE